MQIHTRKPAVTSDGVVLLECGLCLSRSILTSWSPASNCISGQSYTDLSTSTKVDIASKDVYLIHKLASSYSLMSQYVLLLMNAKRMHLTLSVHKVRESACNIYYPDNLSSLKSLIQI